MAHLRSCKIECSTQGCTATATQELRNLRNATMGHYCGKHAKAALKAQEARER